MTVYVIGGINQDIVVTGDSHMRPGQTLTGDNLDYYPGGKGANRAIAAARAGADVAMIACTRRREFAPMGSLDTCIGCFPIMTGPINTTPEEKTTMIAIWVKVRIKAEKRAEFLKAIEVDALGSEADEEGCLRFNVLQDTSDENLYYFYEVYENEAAREVHRAAPHYQVWKAAAHTLDGPTERMEAMPVFPADPAYWSKN